MFKTIMMLGAVALGGLLVAQEASATAIASDGKNGFTLRPAQGWEGTTHYGAPSARLDGIVMTVQSHTSTITKTETGNASVTFIEPTFSDDPIDVFSTWIGGEAIANPDGYAFGTYTLTLTLAFTNQTGHHLDFLSMTSEFSAQWHSAGQFGAQVDNSALEFARYSTAQSGPGIGDSHGCDTRAPTGFVVSNPPAIACGVGSPDESISTNASILDLDDGETKTMTFVLSLTLEASSVPEPATLALLGTGLLGLAGYRRRAQNAACH